MLTYLQRRKLSHLFKLYDVNQDSVLERADYEQIVERLARIHGLPPDSAAYNKLYAERLAIWDFLQREADADKDNRVTLGEFLDAFATLLSNKEAFARLIEGYANTNIELVDRNGDGLVTEQEFIANLLGYNVSPDAATEAFRRLDLNGDGHLTRDEIVKNLNEFFYSDDPEAPGNWFMGPF